MTVSQAVSRIKEALESSLPEPMRVIGEVSNLRVRGHWYFSLKDEKAVLSCVAWATTARRFRFTASDGDEVVATGHVSHYGPQGRTQLYVSKLEPVGAGALELRFREVCQELRKLGYFDEARKKPLPLLPRRIAVITSAQGAAVQDVITTARQRCAAVGLLVVDVRVQGEDAAAEIARAIRWVEREHEALAVDAILLTRGGGSIEDLWPFNERLVADAVFTGRLPIVAAIGHESDTTVAELVADLRASTPTQAVMRMVPSSAELRKQLEYRSGQLHSLLRRRLDGQQQRSERLAGRLEQGMHLLVARARARVERLAGRIAQLQPLRLLHRRRERLAVAADRLRRAMVWRIDQRPRVQQLHDQLHRACADHLRRAWRGLEGLQRELVAVDPARVIERGYSYTTRVDGGLIRSVREVRRGQVIRTQVSDGAFDSVVHDGRSGARRSGPATDGADQMDLFQAGE